MEKYYVRNERIRAESVRVVTDAGENLGVLSKQEALNKARELGLDLVEISPSSDPPVCKILDFKKFLFNKKKQERKARSRSRKSGLKEFRLGPSISDHDLDTRLKRARGFLKENNKVRFTVQFKGRQNAHPEIGEEKLIRIREALSDISRVETAPVKKGRFMSMTLMPV